MAQWGDKAYDQISINLIMNKSRQIPPHVVKAEKILKKHGLAGNDWCAAAYIENPPEVISYHEYFDEDWIVLSYKNGNWTEDKLWFKSEADILKFAKICGAKIEL